jgi:hypothetical protein
LNGSTNPPTLHWRIGERYRLRLISIAAFDGGFFSLLGPDGLLQWRAIAKDGADLPPAQAVMQEARQSALAGEVYDFEYQPTVAGTLQLQVSIGILKMKVAQQIECRLSLFTTVRVLILEDFHGWEPSEFCFIDDSLSVIMAAREPHFLC